MVKIAVLLILCAVGGCAPVTVYDPPVEELRAAPTVEFIPPSNSTDFPFARGISFLEGYARPDQPRFQVVGPGMREIGANCSRDSDKPTIISFAFREHLHYQLFCENQRPVIREIPPQQ